MTRELLLGATRIRREDDDELESVESERIEPGKLTTAELREHRVGHGRGAPGKLTLADAGAASTGNPGKLTLADVGRHVSPGIALHQATALRERRIERDAEHDDVDEGALASAFSFIDQGPGGGALPAALAVRLGTALGVDLSRVRIHTDARAAAAAAKLRARAFTIGEDIYFAAGAYDPVGAAGVRLIAHEVAHVAQNYRGTAPTGGGVSRPSDGHEREADRFADRFASRPLELPWLRRLEQLTSLPAARLAPMASEIQSLVCHATVAGASVVRQVVKLAPASPARKRMLDELGRVTTPAPRTPSRGQIHRDTAKQKATDKDQSTLEERFDYFVQKHKKIRIDARDGKRKTKDGRDRARFGYEDSSDWVRRYWHSSEESSSSRIPDDRQGQFKTAATDRISRRSSAITGWRSASRSRPCRCAQLRVVGGDVPLQAVVMDSRRRSESRRPSAGPSTRGCRGAAEQAGLKGWDIVVFPRRAGYSMPFDSHADDSGDYYANKEADWFLRELVDKVASDPKYQAKSGEFRAFYRDVCVPWSKKPFAERNPGLIGSMFEKLAMNTLDPEDPNRPVFFHGKGDHRYLRRGDFDAIHFDGVNRIIEVKAYTTGPSASVLRQAADYAKVVGAGRKPKVLGYERLVAGEGANEVTYDRVVYVFPTQSISREWYDALLSHRDDPTAFETIPKHTASRAGSRSCARTRRSKSRCEDGKKVDLKNPPVFHPGLEFRDVHLELDGDDKIQRGRLHADLDVGGAVRVKNQPASITPSSDAGIDGQIENDYRKAESKLESLLGTIQPSVKVTDKGVRATLTLPPGSSKLPGIDIERGELSVAFENGSCRSAVMSCRPQERKFRATLAWLRGGQWSSRPRRRSRRA